MTKIPFTVSARTARLIGRENVANAEGAIIELVKNAYDADATLCILFFSQVYKSIPKKLSEAEFMYLNGHHSVFAESYINRKSEYFLKASLSSENIDLINNILLQVKELIIVDNGHGMSADVIKNHWMTIGTDNKETNTISDGGRIKSGSKGIGRFALDRLGSKNILYTTVKKQSYTHKWCVDWDDFEKEHAKINEINASLDKTTEKYQNIVEEITTSHLEIKKLIQKNKVIHGSSLKVTCLRDLWNEKMQVDLFNNLEVLTPPDNTEKFDIFLFDDALKDLFGAVNPREHTDFDYKVIASYEADEGKNIKINIYRNELNLSFVSKDLFQQEEMQVFPFDKKTLNEEVFSLDKTIYDLLPGMKNKLDIDKKLSDIGPFKFIFYFMKRQNLGKGDKEKYPYKEFNSKIREQWLNKFGGIKIFRDEFRVRPFGEINSSSYDWLFLGERQGQSPAGVGRKGGWKVRPNQVSGFVKISRLMNKTLNDKSSREGLQENESLLLFQNILLSVIGVFELDRSTIANNLNRAYQLKNKGAVARQKAVELIERDTKKRKYKKQEKTSQELEEEIEILRDGFQQQEKDLEAKDEELMLLRSLASTGITFTSFAHEFERISNKLHTRTGYLKDTLKDYLSEENFCDTEHYLNPFHHISKITRLDDQLKHWIDFSLAKVKKDRRRRKSIDMVNYFQEMKHMWESILVGKDIDILLNFNRKKIERRIFSMDFDTVFENMITNSVEAFNAPGHSGARQIKIDVNDSLKTLEIVYTDTGRGLKEEYADNPNRIFDFSETSKRNSRGDAIGTGIGMWLVKLILEEYNADISVLTDLSGFGLKIKL